MHTSQGAVVSWLRHNGELSDSDITPGTLSEASETPSRVLQHIPALPVVCNGNTIGAANFNSLPANGVNHWQPPSEEHKSLDIQCTTKTAPLGRSGLSFPRL